MRDPSVDASEPKSLPGRMPRAEAIPHRFDPALFYGGKTATKGARTLLVTQGIATSSSFGRSCRVSRREIHAERFRTKKITLPLTLLSRVRWGVFWGTGRCSFKRKTTPAGGCCWCRSGTAMYCSGILGAR